MVNPQSQFTETSRTRAREIKSRMHEAGTPVTLQQAYELLAKESGFRTWAAMKTSMEAAEKYSQPAAIPAENTTSRLDKLRAQAQQEFIEIMGDYGFNPASVSAGVAYDAAEGLSVGQVKALFSDDPALAEIDTGDEENRSFFWTPRSTVDAMRFAIAVDLMVRIDLLPYADLVEGYGHQPTVARLRKQQLSEALARGDGSVIMGGGGVSYPVTTIR